VTRELKQNDSRRRLNVLMDSGSLTAFQTTEQKARAKYKQTGHITCSSGGSRW